MKSTKEMSLGQLLTMGAVLQGWSIDAEDKRCEDLVAECERHQLFSGGSMETAVIRTRLFR